MKIKRTINGHEYTFEVYQNWIIAQELVNQKYAGYQLKEKTNNNVTCIYKVNSKFFEKNIPKEIGKLICDIDTNRITLYKFVNLDKHYFLKSDSFGINNDILKHLRPSDYIVIETSKKEVYSISVQKALKVGQYLHFQEYELQLFVPITSFKKCKKTKK